MTHLPFLHPAAGGKTCDKKQEEGRDTHIPGVSSPTWMGEEKEKHSYLSMRQQHMVRDVTRLHLKTTFCKCCTYLSLSLLGSKVCAPKIAQITSSHSPIHWKPVSATGGPESVRPHVQSKPAASMADRSLSQQWHQQSMLCSIHSFATLWIVGKWACHESNAVPEREQSIY